MAFDRMSVRLVISDVDGTLVNHAKELTPETIAAVQRLRAAGLHFSLISARPPSGIAPLVTALGQTCPVAAFNGGTILDADGGVIERHVLPQDVVEGCFAIAAGSGADPWLFAGGHWYLFNIANPHVPHERIAAAQEPALIATMAALFADVDKISWVSDDPVLLARLHARMAEAYGDRATIAQSQTYYLDITHLQANKGDGVAGLARIMGVDLADVAVLGDMPNDLPMFARAGLAIAMGQAPAEVRAAARFTSTTNDDGGVAHAIDAILLPMTRKAP
jgi:Cof subfamily protein (haloacid dehalogenase superfamily)